MPSPTRRILDECCGDTVESAAVLHALRRNRRRRRSQAAAVARRQAAAEARAAGCTSASAAVERHGYPSFLREYMETKLDGLLHRMTPATIGRTAASVTRLWGRLPHGRLSDKGPAKCTRLFYAMSTREGRAAVAALRGPREAGDNPEIPGTEAHAEVSVLLAAEASAAAREYTGETDSVRLEAFFRRKGRLLSLAAEPVLVAVDSVDSSLSPPACSVRMAWPGESAFVATLPRDCLTPNPAFAIELAVFSPW